MTDEMKSAGMPAVWNSYISVDDVNAAVNKVTELGGTIAMPTMQAVDAGHMTIIQDPTGAFVSLWQPGQHHGARLANVPNTWCWNELMTRDPTAAQKFFADLFGWEFTREDSSPGNYWMIHNQGRMNGGMLEITEEMGQVPPNWSVYFNVADMKASLETLNSAGGALCLGPFDSSVGPIAIVTDPQGAAFDLIQMTVPPDEA